MYVHILSDFSCSDTCRSSFGEGCNLIKIDDDFTSDTAVNFIAPYLIDRDLDRSLYNASLISPFYHLPCGQTISDIYENNVLNPEDAEDVKATKRFSN